jgi:hypothetical protein
MRAGTSKTNSAAKAAILQQSPNLGLGKPYPIGIFVALRRNFTSHRRQPRVSFGMVTAHLSAGEKNSGNFEKIAAKADHFCKLVS